MSDVEKPVTPNEPMPGTAPAGAPSASVEPPAPQLSPAVSPPVSRPTRRGFDAVLASARVRLALAALVELAVGAASGGTLGLVLALAVVGLAPYSLPLRVLLVGLVPLGALAAASWVFVRRAWPLRHDLVVGAALEASLRRRGA